MIKRKALQSSCLHTLLPFSRTCSYCNIDVLQRISKTSSRRKGADNLKGAANSPPADISHPRLPASRVFPNLRPTTSLSSDTEDATTCLARLFRTVFSRITVARAPGTWLSASEPPAASSPCPARRDRKRRTSLAAFAVDHNRANDAASTATEPASSRTGKRATREIAAA